MVVFDERTAKRSGKSVTDVTMHLLGDGDRFDLRSRTPRFQKEIKVEQVRQSEVQVQNAFARLELLRALTEFAGSRSTRLVMPYEGGRIEIRKQKDFSATIYGGTGAQVGTRGLGMTGLRLDVVR